MASDVQHSSLTKPADRNPFEAYSESGARNIVGEILKFSKSEWTFGRDNQEMPEGAKLIAGTSLIEIGFICWMDGRPVDTVMGRLADGYVPPRRSELGMLNPLEWPRSELDSDYGRPRDPWQVQNILPMVDQQGRVYTYVTGSKGGIQELKRLAGVYGKRVRAHPEEVPIVTLGMSSYRHPNKRLGKIFTPSFAIVGWTAQKRLLNALAQVEVEAEAEEPVEQLAPKRKPKASHDDYPAERPARKKPPADDDEPPYAGEGDDVPF